MEIVYDTDADARLAASATPARATVLVDKFLEGAVEVDVDAVFDGTEIFLGGVMEHIEEAGVHSGDSACVLPPYTLGRGQQRQLREYTAAIAEALGTRGLINIQFAIRDDVIYVLEANPRASRTTPFVSKATGVPLAKVAARVMAGATLAELRDEGLVPALDAVDRTRAGARRRQGGGAAVQPLPGRRHDARARRCARPARSWASTPDFGVAFAKSQAGTDSMVLPAKGTVFVSIANRDKRAMIFPVKRLAELGFDVIATEGTAETLRRAGVQARGGAQGPRGHAQRRRPHRRPARSTWC